MSGCCSTKTWRNCAGICDGAHPGEPVALEDRLDERDIRWLVINDEHLGSTE